jgi:hypothetical protein
MISSGDQRYREFANSPSSFGCIVILIPEIANEMHHGLTRCRVALIGLVAFAGCAGATKKESREEILQRALNDHELPDSAAIMLIGQASFRHFVEAATPPPVKGKIHTTVLVRGDDTSGLASLIRESDPREVRRKLKEIQFVELFGDLDRFLENARKRNLGDLGLTLSTPASGGEASEWVDAYRLNLPAKNFDRYLNTKALKTDERLPQAERLWKVEFDRFKGL